MYYNETIIDLPRDEYIDVLICSGISREDAELTAAILYGQSEKANTPNKYAR